RNQPVEALLPVDATQEEDGASFLTNAGDTSVRYNRRRGYLCTVADSYNASIAQSQPPDFVCLDLGRSMYRRSRLHIFALEGHHPGPFSEPALSSYQISDQHAVRRQNVRNVVGARHACCHSRGPKEDAVSMHDVETTDIRVKRAAHIYR